MKVAPRRRELLNKLIETFGYKSYLEIGCYKGFTFNNINLADKTSVDPYPKFKVTHAMTSDRFFEENTRMFDLIFVDGLHTEDQTYRDVTNALASINTNGTVVMHDCLPLSEEEAGVSGRVSCWKSWRAFVSIRMERPDLVMCTVNMDQGCGVVRKGLDGIVQSGLITARAPIKPPEVPAAMSFDYFKENRLKLMNVVSRRHYYRYLDSIKRRD